MFNQHYKKESPTFTVITRGVGGFGFGAASAADDSGGDGLPHIQIGEDNLFGTNHHTLPIPYPAPVLVVLI